MKDLDHLRGDQAAHQLRIRQLLRSSQESLLVVAFSSASLSDYRGVQLRCARKYLRDVMA